MARINGRHPDLRLELVTMKTTGDKILDKTLDKIGGKGLFVKELDEALLDGHVDICVHSYKDLPVPAHPSLPVIAVSSREDPRDVLILPKGTSEVNRDKPFGSSSLRRKVQLTGLYRDIECEPVRGNIQTRLRKLDEGRFSGLVLAAAGINRLGLTERVSRVFSVTEMLPAACQGILAVQGRAGEDHAYLDAVNDRDSWDAAQAERAFIEELDGGCSTPTAAYAEVSGEKISLAGLFVRDDGVLVRDSIEGRRDVAAELGKKLAITIKRGYSE
jgi:porphobilinogen deaminase